MSRLLGVICVLESEGKESNRRSFIRKIVGVAAFGGLASALFGQKLEKVSAAGAANQIAYYTAPDTYAGSDNLRWYNTDRNFVAGYSFNTVTATAVGATISGGGAVGNTNRVTDNYGTVGGGINNQAGDNAGTVSDAQYATVGGGIANKASGISATVGGGAGNWATENYATVGGGATNTASGASSTVPGGASNTAGGDWSFAAGRRAKIDAAHDGAFLFADMSDYDFKSSAASEFAVRATGGARFVTAIDGTGAPSKSFVMTPGGYLGVGTEKPTSRLHATCDTSTKEDTGITVEIPGVGDRRIVVGPKDSAGTGYRSLRVAN